MIFKLTIELVPRTSFYTNVRSNVSANVWNIIRKDCYAKANYRCEICNGIGQNQGYKWSVECHEIWNYDDTTNVQKLVGLIALCPKCHMVKHIGLTQIKGKMDIAIKHFMSVNKCSKSDALNYISGSFKIWEKRSNKEWKLDISHIESIIKSNKKN